jgi:PleD family two-component response regulator
MTQPLALLLYEKLFPGSHLVTRLEDLGYRVQSLSEPGNLVKQALEAKPLLIVADAGPEPESVFRAITELTRCQETSHIPVVAITPEAGEEVSAQGREAGARLVVQENAILAHLAHFLDQALEL